MEIGHSFFIIMVLIVICLILIFYSFAPTQTSVPALKAILNLTGVSNSSGLINAIQTGLTNHTSFEIVYYGSASATIPPFSLVKETGNLSIIRDGQILEVALSTGNPALLFSQQNPQGTYSSTSEYNGTGFLLCINRVSGCQYRQAEQNDNFAGELSSSLSGLFSSNFIFNPYLDIMNETYSVTNSSNFILTYLGADTYNGNPCSSFDFSSTSAFAVSRGISISGKTCLSDAIGLPLSAQATVVYNGVSLSISVGSILIANSTS